MITYKVQRNDNTHDCLTTFSMRLEEKIAELSQELIDKRYLCGSRCKAEIVEEYCKSSRTL